MKPLIILGYFFSAQQLGLGSFGIGFSPDYFGNIYLYIFIIYLFKYIIILFIYLEAAETLSNFVRVNQGKTKKLFKNEKTLKNFF